MTPEALREVAKAGGIDVPVSYLDGTTETVKVRFIPRTDFPAFVEFVVKEPAIVDLICGKADGWSETLSDQSFEEVLNLGRSINLERVLAYARRALEMQKAIMPEINTAAEILASRKPFMRFNN